MFLEGFPDWNIPIGKTPHADDVAGFIQLGCHLYICRRYLGIKQQILDGRRNYLAFVHLNMKFGGMTCTGYRHIKVQLAGKSLL